MTYGQLNVSHKNKAYEPYYQLVYSSLEPKAEKITENRNTSDIPERLQGSFRIGSPSPISTLKTAEILEYRKKTKGQRKTHTVKLNLPKSYRTPS